MKDVGVTPASSVCLKNDEELKWNDDGSGVRILISAHKQLSEMFFHFWDNLVKSAPACLFFCI